ncbi:MAG: twin-arginine translocation signal domain-containing protein [Reyranella sp.]|nr:twin-arginine translocation signal domain-containing protein [Reyranella sp.]
MAAAWPGLSLYASQLSCREIQQTDRDRLKGRIRKSTITTRRSFLGQAGAGGLALVSGSAWADSSVELPHR